MASPFGNVIITNTLSAMKTICIAYVNIFETTPDNGRMIGIIQKIGCKSGLRLYDFKCAWFNEQAYYEFFPLHVVYKFLSPFRCRR